MSITKKLSCTLLIALLVCCLVVTSFAFVNTNVSDTVADSKAPTLDEALYLPMDSPQVVALNSAYTVAVCDSTISVHSGNDYYIMENIPAADFYPHDVAIAGHYIMILYLSQDNISSYLAVIDLISKSHVDIDFTAILGVIHDAKTIDADGDNLYIHNTANSIIRLDTTDNFAHTVMGINSNILDKATSFVVEQGVVYISNQQGAVVKIVNNSASNIFTKSDIISFDIIGGNVAYLSSDRIGYYITESDVELEPYYVDGIENFAILNNKIYYCHNQSNRIKILDIGAVVKDSGQSLGDSGDEVNRFNSPQDIAVQGNYAYIADTANHRISIVDTTTMECSVVALSGDIAPISPTLIAISSSLLAVYDGGSKIYFYSIKGNTLTFVFVKAIGSLGKIVDMAYHYDDLVVLDSSGQLSIIDVEITPITAVEGAKALVANSNSEYLYVFSNVVHKVNMSTSVIDTVYDYDIQGYSDFVVDYAGNIFAVSHKGDKVDKLSRQVGQYALDKTITTDRWSDNLAIAFDKKKGNVYAIDTAMHKLNYLMSKDLESVSYSEIGYDHPAKDDWNVVQVGIIKADGTTAYLAPNNDESVEIIAKDEPFLILSTVLYQGAEYSYGIIEGNSEYCYILTQDLTMVDKTTYQADTHIMTAVFPSGVTVRQFPFKNADSIIVVNRPKTMSLVDNVACIGDTHIWQWYKVKYIGDDGVEYIGYVEANDIYYANAVAPPKNRVFLTVKADGVGKSVTMYKDASLESEILLDNIQDGTKVVLGTEEFVEDSEFTKVVYDNISGYVLTDNLITSGLTPNQTTAIVVTSVCVVIFVLLIVLLCWRKSYFNRKKGIK